MKQSGKPLFVSLLLHGAAVVMAATCALQKPPGLPAAGEDDEPWGSLVAELPSPFNSDASTDEQTTDVPPESQADPVAALRPTAALTLDVPPLPAEMLATGAPAPLAAIQPPATLAEQAPRKSARKSRSGHSGAMAGSAGNGNGGGNGVFSPARYSRCPAPPFPAEARKLKLHGTVLLLVDVDESGRPGAIAVRHSSGHEMLDSAALRAVRAWRFEPARLSGKPVSSRVEVPVRFALS